MKDWRVCEYYIAACPDAPAVAQRNAQNEQIPALYEPQHGQTLIMLPANNAGESLDSIERSVRP